MKRSPAISISNYNKKSCLPPQQQLVHRLKPRKQKQNSWREHPLKCVRIIRGMAPCV